MIEVNIAVLLTCFNRKEKTLSSIRALFDSVETYNRQNCKSVTADVFLTDDGCSDGTSDAVVSDNTDKNITIVKADGNAYWAGGMRMAWQAAMQSNKDFDFFLLLNDDTIVKKECISELLSTDQYCINTFRKSGVYTGFTSSMDNESNITYGAKVYKKGILSGAVDMKPMGSPQLCDMPNANIMLVSKEVCGSIGMLSSDYIHGAADWDYGIMATKAGYPVLTTSVVCGYCEKDHDMAAEEYRKFVPLSIKERKRFLDRPTGNYTDGLTFFLKHNKAKYIILRMAYFVNLYLPSVFYRFFQRRGH